MIPPDVMAEHFEEVLHAKGEEELASIALRHMALAYRARQLVLMWITIAALGWATALPVVVWVIWEGPK